MDLSNFINTGQPYEPYQELPEDLQPHLPIPQLQLPPRTLTGDPPAITTLHDGRIYRYVSPRIGWKCLEWALAESDAV